MNDEMKESQDSKAHDVVRARLCHSWQEFFELAERIGVPAAFLSDRGDASPQERPLL
jgi:hypothetical protein